MLAISAVVLSFAPGPKGPCEKGFVPTCEQAKGFGMCNMPSVHKECAETCSTEHDTSGHHLHEEMLAVQPGDYTKPISNLTIQTMICNMCEYQPDLSCCHNHPHAGRSLAFHEGVVEWFQGGGSCQVSQAAWCFHKGVAGIVAAISSCTSFPCPLEAADAWCCLEPWSSYSDLMGGSQGFCPDAQEAADRISSFGEVVQGLLKTLG